MTGSASCATIMVNPSHEEMEGLEARFALHPLIIGDLLAGRQQPKFEKLGGHLYLSLWDLSTDGTGQETATTSSLSVIFDERSVIFVQQGPQGQLRDLKAVLSRSGPLPVASSVAAVYRVLDAVVSDFVSFGTDIESELDAVEEEVFDTRVREDYQRIYRLRGRIGQVDRAASGLADALRAARREIQALTESSPELRPYFVHLAHDAVGIAQLATAEHSELDAVVSSHHSNVATRQNENMRTISAFAALLAIPTVVAGFYGMNFKNLPLLHWEYGWGVTFAGMVVIDVGVYLLFRHRGWLGGKAAARSDGDGPGEE